MRTKKPKIPKVKVPKAHKIKTSMAREHPIPGTGRSHKIKSSMSREHPVEPAMGGGMGIAPLRSRFPARPSRRKKT